MTDRFDICLPYTLAQECPFPSDWSNLENFSNDAHDPGGETMCGIIQREYDVYRKSRGEICCDVRKITRDEGYAIYRGNYWLPHCPVLPPGLDLAYFDSAVNEGCVEATRILQWSLYIDHDGKFGPDTAAAVAAIADVLTMVNTFTIRRKAVYHMMRGFRYFGSDWIRRSDEIGHTAVKMVTELQKRG